MLSLPLSLVSFPFCSFSLTRVYAPLSVYPLCITPLLFTQFSPLGLSPYPLLLPLDMLVRLVLSGALFVFFVRTYYHIVSY